MTTLTALARPRVLLRPGPMRRGFLFGFVAMLLLGLLAIIGASGAMAISHANRVMPGVSVAGIPIGGLDRAAAIERLESQLPSLDDGTLTLQVDEVARKFPVADLHRSYDLDATVDAAFAVARSGNPLVDGVTRLRTLAHATAVTSAGVVLDPVALDEIVSEVAAAYDHPAADGSVKFRKKDGFVAAPAVEGVTVDAAGLGLALNAALADSRGDVALDVPVSREEPAVSTRDALAAAISANWMSSQQLKLTGGGLPLKISAPKLAALITFGELPDGGWGASVNEKALARLLRPIEERVAVAPRNASFAWGGNGAVGFFPGEAGRRLKTKATIGTVTAALQQRAAGSLKPSAPLAMGVVAPALTNAEARAAAPQMELLSTWTTYYIPGDGNFWGANINIPAQDLNGRVIAPGEWFEFWQGIGPVTLERGYGMGGAIIGGRSVANGALAGGICSTSTTLFNAAMRAGLEIGQRVNHSYYIDRYPVGLDATVFKTDSYETDMTFRNDMATPVVIRSYTGNGFVRFDIWGVPDGRTVSLSAPTTSNHGTAIETTVVNSSLAPGSAVRVEYPHDGFDAVVTRWVRDANGNLLHENTWYSHYRTVNGITEVGPKRS
ncbi:MAG TPA: VanW family protein [Candidatus Limnocylindria bacterium]|nr:VanW family protein [Candidatus Limnocylindria bacterium]